MKLPLSFQPASSDIAALVIHGQLNVPCEQVLTIFVPPTLCKLPYAKELHKNHSCNYTYSNNQAIRLIIVLT